MEYLFHLGREETISENEILAVLSRHKYKYTGKKRHGAYMRLCFQSPIDTVALMKIFGGTVKISEHIALSGKKLAAEIAVYLDSVEPDGKIIFSLWWRKKSDCSGGEKNLIVEVKKEIKLLGRAVRYVEPKNTATVEYNNLVERHSDITLLAGEAFATVAVQPFADFGKRDYGRPGRDSKSGMLPPKLARMMVNLAGAHADTTLLDPFCGSGTIVTEALLLGYRNIIGSDISDRAVRDTKNNCRWVRTEYGIKPDARIFPTDSGQLANMLKPASVGAIVTEPYLGQPATGKETKKQLDSQLLELENLYIKTFTAFDKILMPGGIVIWAMPSFLAGHEWLEINPRKIIGEHFSIEKFPSGQESLFYARAGQHVGRRLWKFKKQTPPISR